MARLASSLDLQQIRLTSITTIQPSGVISNPVQIHPSGIFPSASSLCRICRFSPVRAPQADPFWCLPFGLLPVQIQPCPATSQPKSTMAPSSSFSSIHINDVVKEMSELFGEHDDLIEEFNTFLPEEYRIRVTPSVTFDNFVDFIRRVKRRLGGDVRLYKSFVEILCKYMTERPHIAEVERKVWKLFQNYPDIQEELLHLSEDQYMQEEGYASDSYNKLSGNSSDVLHEKPKLLRRNEELTENNQTPAVSLEAKPVCASRLKDVCLFKCEDDRKGFWERTRKPLSLDYGCDLSVPREPPSSTPNPVRQWPMPPPAISLHDFRRLIQKRAQALSHLPGASGLETQEEKLKHEEEGVCGNSCSPPEAAAADPQIGTSQPKIEKDAEGSQELQAVVGDCALGILDGTLEEAGAGDGDDMAGNLCPLLSTLQYCTAEVSFNVGTIGPGTLTC